MKRDKQRTAAPVDKNGNNVVFDNGLYRIVVDSPNNATYVTLWYMKDKWQKVGALHSYKKNLWLTRIDKPHIVGLCLSIDYIEISPKHRGLGYAKKMYRALIDFSAPDVKGLFSYLPNRSNKKQIPRIYASFGAETIDDYQYINFDN
jgi:ribosomal protein S18 acetylase RimI-like enzyme